MFKTEPLPHQRALLDSTKERPSFGLFWDPGCGKTKPILDTAAHLFRQGKINTLLVVAPNGVHRNWVSDEVPKHFPDDIPLATHVHHTSSAETRRAQESVEQLFAPNVFSILVLSYDSFRTDAGKELAKRCLTKRRCLFVADESHRIKTPGAKTTKIILQAARLAPYRRILTGTPVANSPFDVYSQVKFLEQDYWKQFQIGNYLAFQHEFGVFRSMQSGSKTFNKVVDYRRLDQLKEWLRPISSRLTKEEAGLDLPPKVYTKRYFALSPEQKRIYLDLKTLYISSLADGQEISAPLAIVRLTRLHQVTCGYVPTDEDGELRLLDDNNRRLNLLSEVLEDITTKVIIWARFHKDIDLIMERLGAAAVRYDGLVGPLEREQALDRFRNDPEVLYFVANPATISMGVTLTQAKAVIYYSNSFNLTDRIQSEDRAHRIGQDSSVLYVDLIAEGTVDSRIVSALRDKKEIASIVTGDVLKEWI